MNFCLVIHANISKIVQAKRHGLNKEPNNY